jgi:hypothetical protein
LILASFGLGSMALGGWLQSHKGLFLTVALSLMTLSFISAIREKKKTGKNTGLVIFASALLITAGLLSYNKIRYGYFM